jgi:hypothetical protein
MVFMVGLPLVQFDFKISRLVFSGDEPFTARGADMAAPANAKRATRARVTNSDRIERWRESA